MRIRAAIVVIFCVFYLPLGCLERLGESWYIGLVKVYCVKTFNQIIF